MQAKTKTPICNSYSTKSVVINCITTTRLILSWLATRRKFGNGYNDILSTGVRYDWAEMGLHAFYQVAPLQIADPVEVVGTSAYSFTFTDVNGDGINDMVIADFLKDGVIAYLAEAMVSTPSPTSAPAIPTPAPLTPKHILFGNYDILEVAASGSIAAFLARDRSNATTPPLHIYSRLDGDSNIWTEESLLSIEGNRGSSIAVGGNTVIVGTSAYVGDNSVGAAYVFVRSESGEWSQQEVLSVDGFFDDFGTEVAVDGDTAVMRGGIMTQLIH